jgi:hypothetical protein
MLLNWNLYKKVFYSGVVCVYKAWVGGIYRVPRSAMWQKLSSRRCCRGADRPPRVAGRLGIRGEPTSLPWILSCRHMERYSRERLDPSGYKVGPTSQVVGRPAVLLGPPGRGFDLRGPHGLRLTVVTLVWYFVELPLVTFEKLQISYIVPEIK